MTAGGLTCPECGEQDKIAAYLDESGAVMFLTCEQCGRAWSNTWAYLGRRKEIVEMRVESINNRVFGVSGYTGCGLCGRRPARGEAHEELCPRITV